MNRNSILDEAAKIAYDLHDVYMKQRSVELNNHQMNWAENFLHRANAAKVVAEQIISLKDL